MRTSSIRCVVGIWATMPCGSTQWGECTTVRCVVCPAVQGTCRLSGFHQGCCCPAYRVGFDTSPAGGAACSHGAASGPGRSLYCLVTWCVQERALWGACVGGCCVQGWYAEAGHFASATTSGAAKCVCVGNAMCCSGCGAHM